jgi:hypothetical protein
MRSVLGVKFGDKMKSEDIREHLGLENKAKEMINYQREWKEHLEHLTSVSLSTLI